MHAKLGYFFFPYKSRGLNTCPKHSTALEVEDCIHLYMILS